MQSGGFLSFHNHKEGWLSGSFYLKVPKRKSNEDSGSIIFSEQGPPYPKKKLIKLKPSKWKCPRRDLNPRPLPYQGSALPLSYKGLWKDGPGWI